MKRTRCVTTSIAAEAARLGLRRSRHGRRSICRMSPSREMRSRRFWSASRPSRQPEWRRRRHGLPSRWLTLSVALRWSPSRLRQLPPQPAPRERGLSFPAPRRPSPRHRLQRRLPLPQPLPLPPRSLQLLPLPCRDGLFPFHGRQRLTLSSHRRLPADPLPGPWWPSRQWPQRRPLLWPLRQPNR